LSPFSYQLDAAFSGFCQQSGKTILSASESSPEPGTDLGALSVGSSGGNLNPAQEQSRRDMMAREIFFTINQCAPGGPLDVKAGNTPLFAISGSRNAATLVGWWWRRKAGARAKRERHEAENNRRRN
jgi:hypothetical protein